MGMAMTTATRAMKMVSGRIPAMPKWWMSGSQAWVVRKENLATRMAGQAWMVRKTPMAAKMPSTTRPLVRVRPRNTRSPVPGTAVILRLAGGFRVSSVARDGTVVVIVGYRPATAEVRGGR
jgi:hypothetical protein